MEYDSQSYDAVVMGAGIMGSSTAFYLASAGKRVLLLEQFSFLHRRGSSHGDSRIIRRTYPEDFYTAMMPRAYELWEEAERVSGMRVLTRTGGLDFGPPDSPDFLAVRSSCSRHSVPHEILTPEEVSSRFPSFHLPEHYSAIYCPDAGILNATNACAMFQRLALESGATLQDETEVIGLSNCMNHSTSATEGGGQEAVAGESQCYGEASSQGVLVTTSKGAFRCSKAVLCAGAWSAALLQRLVGVRPPIQPLHTTVVYWKVQPQFEAAYGSSQFPVFINYDEPYIYGMASHELPGHIKVSLHSGPPCDPASGPREPLIGPARTALGPWISRIFAEQVASEPAHAESCMYSMTPDQDFIIDEVAISQTQNDQGCRLWVAAGFSGHGFKFGPLIGKAMADLALKGSTTEIPMGIFSMKRFQERAEGNLKAQGPQVRPLSGTESV